MSKKKMAMCRKLGLDGVFSPAWSPAGVFIAFVGFQNGQSDIYLWNRLSREVDKLTDDVFSDLEHGWSPDGKRLAFVSDRQDFLDAKALPKNFRIDRFDYRSLDIYVKEIASSEVKGITDTPTLEHTPVFEPTKGEFIAYTSDESGISNIYLQNLQDGDVYPITNVLTGISYISWAGDGSKLAFSSFYDGGYDIYLLQNPLNIESEEIKLTKTEYMVDHGAKRKTNHTFAEIEHRETIEKRNSRRIFCSEMPAIINTLAYRDSRSCLFRTFWAIIASMPIPASMATCQTATCW